MSSFKMGDKVRSRQLEHLSNHDHTKVMTVKKIYSGGELTVVQVEFTGPGWFYPMRCWYAASELEAA